MAILHRKCKVSKQTRSIFQGTLEECLAYKLELINTILIDTLKEHPHLDEDTIVIVEDAYFNIEE